MAGLTDSEIRSVMAHELGHLTSKDCIAGTAYFLTAYLPGKASRILGKGWRAAKTVLKISLSGGLLGVAIAIFLFYYFHILKYAGALFFYLLLLYLFNHLFGFLWSLNRRYTEYRQDAFAQKIGLGDDLRVALGKIIKNQPQKVSLFDILQSDYPIIHNRIRRLEKMEGLRE
jgi:Zn-dependent protease with chaperone function